MALRIRRAAAIVVAVVLPIRTPYHEFMKYKSTQRGTRARGVAEPVQVYLDPADRERLDRLTERLGATKSDVLRRALAALESSTRASAEPAGAAVLPTFAGSGLQTGVNLDDTAGLLDLMERPDETR